MSRNLLSSLDRSLARRATSNAAAAVRADARHAAEREEAAQALTASARPPRLSRLDAR